MNLPLMIAGAIGGTFLALHFADKIDVSAYMAQLSNLPKSGTLIELADTALLAVASIAAVVGGGFGLMGALSTPRHAQDVVRASYTLALEQAKELAGRTAPLPLEEVCDRAVKLVEHHPRTTPRLNAIVARGMREFMSGR